LAFYSVQWTYIMGVGCVPVYPAVEYTRRNPGLKELPAAWVDCITKSTSVPLVGGLEEREVGLLLSPVD
jgi:hypothetical protein